MFSLFISTSSCFDPGYRFFFFLKCVLMTYIVVMHISHPDTHTEHKISEMHSKTTVRCALHGTFTWSVGANVWRRYLTSMHIAAAAAATVFE